MKNYIDAMLDFGATIGSYLGSDYNQTRLKMDDIYTFEKKFIWGIQ